MDGTDLQYRARKAEWWLRAAGPQTAQELCTRMQCTVGAMLTALAVLHEQGLVSSVYVPGSSLWWLVRQKEAGST